MVEKVRHALTLLVEILSAAAKRFGYVRANRMAAAIAYRTFFSLTPLLFVAVGLFGAVVGDDAQAQAEILANVESVAGEPVADAISRFLGATLEVSDTAALLGLLLVLWTASSLFLEIQHDLDDIFGVPYEHTSGVVAFVKKRGKGFLWTLGLGLLLVAVWSLNFAWRFVGGLFPPDAVGVHELIGFLAPLLSLIVLPAVFALIVQTMSSKLIPWRAVWYGAGFTSVVFLLVAYGIGLYFALDTTPSGLTVAGSVFIILFTAFALSSVFLFGANVTKVYSDYLQGEGWPNTTDPSH